MKKNVAMIGLGACLGVGLALGGQPIVAKLSAVGDESTTQRRCDYTYIYESGRPNIGHQGEIKYDKSWSDVLDAGWDLAFAHPVGNGTSFVFKKCGM